MNAAQSVNSLPSNQVTMAQLQEQMAALIAENARLKANKSSAGLALKVSEKGAVSLYGINARFPISLYANQWEKVLAKADDIREFIKTNEALLSVKPTV